MGAMAREKTQGRELQTVIENGAVRMNERRGLKWKDE